MEINLERFAYTPNGVFGKIIIPEFECYTVERPWLDNKPRHSCIPEGEYEILLSHYNRGDYPAYELIDVPDRSLIKIHIGNTIDDVIGCIALGKSLGFLEKKWGVSNSRKAFNEFMQAMDGIRKTKINIYQYVP